jgi:hypothetical protein
MNKIWSWYIGLFKPQATPALTFAKRFWGGVVIPVLLFTVVFSVVYNDSPEGKRKAREEQLAKDKEQLEYNVEDTMRKLIYDKLKDPQSYQRISFTMTHYGKSEEPCVLEYRSKNGFGGYNSGRAMAWYDNATQNVKMVSYE